MECVKCGKKIRGRASPTGVCPACRGEPKRESKTVKISVRRETAKTLKTLAAMFRKDVSGVIEKMIAGQVYSEDVE